MTKEKLIEILEIDFRECIEKAISDDIVRDEYELRDALELAIEIVRKEESEQQTGKQIYTHEQEEWYGNVYKCSACGSRLIETDNYCPHCGRRMVEDERQRN